jgi:hypothetical protein
VSFPLSIGPPWLSRSPRVRRTAINLWRILLRVQRATLAQAVLIIYGDDGRVLVHALTSGRLELPRRELSGWIPIETQVHTWLAQLPYEKSVPAFVSVEGTPGVAGVTFLYTTKLEGTPNAVSDDVWLDLEAANVALSASDRHLLSICARAARN